MIWKNFDDAVHNFGVEEPLDVQAEDRFTTDFRRRRRNGIADIVKIKWGKT